MNRDDSRSARVRAFVTERGSVTNRDIVRSFRVSPATAHRVLRQLVRDGVLELTGKGRAARYRFRSFRRRFRLVGLAEHDAWRTAAAHIERVRPLPTEERRSLDYGALEMINNAIEHSQGATVAVAVAFSDGATKVSVEDDGVGVYARLMRDFAFPSPADAIVQLEKGKLTTDATRHTGEGIFFTSKTVSRFRLEAQGTAWIVDNVVGDSAIARSSLTRGTLVTLEVAPGKTPVLAEVFRRFTDQATLRFAKTRTTIRLAAVGTELLSRSEARRVTLGLEKFEDVTLDFSGVALVGQGFCDELFRVFARAWPRTKLIPVGMDDTVRFMVERAMAAAP